MNQRNDTVLIQQASGDYQALLALTVQAHLAYCYERDIDYWPIFGETRPGGLQKMSPHYDRIHLIDTALNAGYKGVIWLDADCIINPQAEDLRGGIPDEGIGAVWCSGEWGDNAQYDHWCTGALYIRSTPAVQHFVNTWKWLPDEEHGWYDQHTFNRLNRRYPVAVPLAGKWHSIETEACFRTEKANVVAFHGYGDLEARFEIMRLLLEGRQ